MPPHTSPPPRCVSAARAPANELVLASYNIHRCVGGDGRFAPDRIVAVLRELDADIIALQEVESNARTGFDMLKHLAAAMGMTAIAGPTLTRRHAHYGNAVLTRLEVVKQRSIDLSVRGREPRGAIEAVVDCGGRRLCVVATHLGLGPGERRQQVKRLLSLFQADLHGPAALVGDINEWYLWGRPLRWLHVYFKNTPAPLTFPARLPVFALDRVWLRPAAALRRLEVHRSPLARIASDHLPLKAHIAVEALGEPRPAQPVARGR